MENRFSLIDEPWIPCVYTDGHSAEVSLSTLFREASTIKEVSGTMPQQRLPLLRLLLALLYCFYYEEGLNEESLRTLWHDTWDAGSFDMEAVEGYFSEWHDRFFLFGERPFFQTPSLEYSTDREFDSVGEIIADVPKPEKFLFSLRSQNALESLPLSEAACWLVFMQAYDTAGIKTPVQGNKYVTKGKVYAPKGVVSTGWLGAIGGVFIEGDTLFETLMLNWCLYDGNGHIFLGDPSDVPVWEQEDAPLPNQNIRAHFSGPIDALTMQTRRLRLVPNDACSRVIGIVNCYGDIVPPYNTNDVEMMTAWRESKPQQKKLGLSTPPLMPVTHDASKALWRGLAPILRTSESEGSADLRPGVVRWAERLQADDRHVLDVVSIHAQGMAYGTQNSVFDTGIDDKVSLHSVMLRHDYGGIEKVLDVVKCTEEAVGALVLFVRNLQASAGDKGMKFQAAEEQIKENAYSELDGLFRDRLAAFGPDEDMESYANAWKDDVHRRLLNMGRDYLAQSPTPVFASHDSGRLGIMGAARAQLIYHGKLNKVLGPLPGSNGDRDMQGKENDRV